jgi:hypothetical protein
MQFNSLRPARIACSAGGRADHNGNNGMMGLNAFLAIRMAFFRFYPQYSTIPWPRPGLLRFFYGIAKNVKGGQVNFPFNSRRARAGQHSIIPCELQKLDIGKGP